MSREASAMTAEEVYEIRVQGRLGADWSSWFDDLTIENLPDGETVLCGPVADQAALHGLLGKVRNLGLPLVSVQRVG